MLTAPVSFIVFEAIGGRLGAHALLLNPIMVVSGAIHALFRVAPADGPLAAAALPATTFALAVAAIVGGSVALLLSRYRRIRV
jgi:hypothetical protein